MGERAGYRARQGRLVSPILRKQWFLGDSEDDLKWLVTEVAKRLLCMTKEYKVLGVKGEQIINSGLVALRSDLDIHRLTAALYDAVYTPPFDSIEFTYDCDIGDHGLYEIELKRWNVWVVNHYNVGRRVGGRKFLLAAKFIPDRPLSTGVVWLDREEYLAELIKPEEVIV